MVAFPRAYARGLRLRAPCRGNVCSACCFYRLIAYGLRLRLIYNALPTTMPVFSLHGLRQPAPYRGIDWQVGRFVGWRVWRCAEALEVSEVVRVTVANLIIRAASPEQSQPSASPWGTGTHPRAPSPVPTGFRPWQRLPIPFRDFDRFAGLARLSEVAGLQDH